MSICRALTAVSSVFDLQPCAVVCRVSLVPFRIRRKDTNIFQTTKKNLQKILSEIFKVLKMNKVRNKL